MGPVGPTGATGADGPQGIQGIQGIQGPAGPTLLKRTTFSFVTIPPSAGGAVQIATLTFTPPVSGTALIMARGFCNINALAAGTTTGLNMGIGSTLANAFGGTVPEWGVTRLPGGRPTTAQFAQGWTAETTRAVTAGVAQTVGLAGRHEAGTVNDDCTDSLWVEVFTGNLP
jgi:hypothetical protein